MLSWTKLMKDLITLNDSTRKNTRKPERDRRHDEQNGRIKYQKRRIQEREADEEIQEFKSSDKSGTDRVY